MDNTTFQYKSVQGRRHALKSAKATVREGQGPGLGTLVAVLIYSSGARDVQQLCENFKIVIRNVCVYG